jgi:hypothetical protein
MYASTPEDRQSAEEKLTKLSDYKEKMRKKMGEL